ncbi:MAG: biotin/lipoyl-containing protein [Candidatus Bathyarchaeia archaeon]
MKDHEVLVNKKPHKIKILEEGEGAFVIEVNNKIVEAKIRNAWTSETVAVEINGNTVQANVKKIQHNLLQIDVLGKTFNVEFPTKIPQEIKLEPPTKKSQVSPIVEKDAVTAPIAGKIVLLKAKVGQKVERGEGICILEAMKMENEVSAPKAGIIKEIRVCEGTVVNKGDVLAIID